MSIITKENVKLYNPQARINAEAYIERVTKDMELTASQKLYYPQLVDLIQYKSFYHLNDPRGEFRPRLTELYVDIFPELFI